MIGLIGMVAGFGVLAYVDPIIAGGVGLVLVGAALVVHAAVRALASRFGMGDVV